MGAGAQTSSGSNNYVSQPQNLQQPTFNWLSQPAGYGLANIGQYLGNQAFAGGAPTTAFNGQTTGFLSPYFGNFGSGNFNYNNPNGNPLVAPVTGTQSNLLNQSVYQSDPFNA